MKNGKAACEHAPGGLFDAIPDSYNVALAACI